MSEKKKPVNVFFEGKLGKIVGRKWSLYVDSPSEALRAVNINTKGKLREYLSTEGAKKYYKIALQEKDNLIEPEKEISHPSGQSDIYIIPTIKGSSSGTAKIVVGAILVIVGIILISKGGGALVAAGLSLMAGGIIQLMTPIPQAAQPSSEEDLRASQIFQGNAVNVYQGSSVGVVYGRSLVAPMPISLSLDNQNIGLWGSIPYRPIDEDELNGGGNQPDGGTWGRTS